MVSMTTSCWCISVIPLKGNVVTRGGYNGQNMGRRAPIVVKPKGAKEDFVPIDVLVLFVGLFQENELVSLANL